ncbi:Uridine-cytidine kinase-like 1, partial [Kappamyces sp. JEL0680]
MATPVSPLGKKPWFSATGVNQAPFIIGIAGGSASGKTSVSQRIIKQLGVPWVTLLCMDSFYNALTPQQIQLALQNDFDFDHPNAFDHDKLLETLDSLKKGQQVDVPVYDFATHSRLKETEKVYGASVIIFEGIFALYDKRVRDLMDMKIFVDTDADVCLGRRLKRDITERGRDVDGILTQYARFVKPAFDDFIFPTKKYADVIIPRGLENTVAIDLITKHVQLQLNARGVALRSVLCTTNTAEITAAVKLIPQSPQILSLIASLQSQETRGELFVQDVDALSCAVVQEGLKEAGFLVG